MQGDYFRKVPDEELFPKIAGKHTYMYEYLPIYESLTQNDNVEIRHYPISLFLSPKALSITISGNYKQEILIKEEAEHQRAEGKTKEKEEKYLSDNGRSHTFFEIDFEQKNKSEIQEMLVDIADEKNSLFDLIRSLQNSDVYSKESVKSITGIDEGLKGVFQAFIHDFFQSNVFTEVPFYYLLESKLLNIPFIKAINTKYDFLFSQGQKKLAVDEINSIEGEQSTQEETSENIKENRRYYEQKLKYWKKRIKTASKAWLAIIRDPQYEEIIKPQNCWFEDIEDEHKLIFGHKKNGKLRYRPLQIDEATYLKEEAETSASWLLERKNLWEVFQITRKVIYQNPFNWMIVVLGIIIPIGLLWYFKILSFPFTNTSFLFQFISILAIMPILLASMAIVERSLSLIRTFYKAFKNIEVKNKYLVGLEFKHFIKYADSLTKHITFFRPKILLSSFGVWTFIFASDRFWNIDFKIGFIEIALILILLTGAIFFMIAKFQKIISGPNKGKRLFYRIVPILLLGISYSFIIGFVEMSVSAEQALTKEKKLSHYFVDNEQVVCRLSKTGRTNLFAQVPALLKRNQDALLRIADSLYKEPDSLKRSLLLQKREQFRDGTPDSILSLFRELAEFRSLSQKNILYQAIKDSLQPPKITEYQTILSMISPINLDKKLFEEVLPYLYVSNPGPNNQKSFLTKKNYFNFINRDELEVKYPFYILPDMLIFYTVIALSIGIFIDLSIKN